MKKRGLILGTRGSALALAQANQVRAMIHQVFPALDVEIKIIKTSGDKKTGISLATSGIKGLFTKELEQALLLGKIDLAVHSLKDVLTEIPAGLTLGAVLKRVEPHDVMLFHPETEKENPRRVFTSSPRRKLQTHQIWPEAEILEIRGNVETRISKLLGGEPGDATLLAAAGMLRLDLIPTGVREGVVKTEPDIHFRKLDLNEMLPSPGQAAIAIEIRQEDGETQEKIRPLNHAATKESVFSERAFLQGMGGGCATPIGAYAYVDHDQLHLKAVVGSADGGVWKGERKGNRNQGVEMGLDLARECKSTIQVLI